MDKYDYYLILWTLPDGTVVHSPKEFEKFINPISYCEAVVKTQKELYEKNKKTAQYAGYSIYKLELTTKII